MRRMQVVRAWVSVVLAALLVLPTAGPLPTAYAEDPPDGAPGETTQLPPPPPVKQGSPKLEGQLNAAVNAYAQGGPVAAANTVGRSPTPLIETDNLRLVLETDLAASAAVEAAVQAAGGTVESRYDDLVQVLVPFTGLKRLEQEAGVRFIRFPHVPQPDVVLSEGVARTAAQVWHNVGLTGAGVKVAIVDIGFTGYLDLLNTELPASVTIQCFCSSGDINGGGEVHGTAVAEIVHDMAPDAQLYLVRVVTEVDLANAVTYLLGQGVKVVNHSVSWYNTGGGTGDGPINAAVATARAGGILWVNSSGNQARNYYEGTWNDPNADNWHNFSGGDAGNTVTINGGACVTIYLSWDQWPASNQDYNLYLYASDFTTVIASSVGAQTGSQKPTERLSGCVSSTATYHIAIYRQSATQAVKFRMFVLGVTPQYFMASGSMGSPADSPDALTVGAVAYNLNTIENYSSQGPTQDGRTKPDIAGPDRVSTATYGAGAFTGTSSAAPHVAGAAALVQQGFPAMTPVQVQAYLEQRGVDLGTAGKDNVFGSGMVTFGQLDPTFSRDGRVATDIDGHHDYTKALALQPDGKIVVAGWIDNMDPVNYYPLALVRYTASGALDPTFGSGGKVTTTTGFYIPESSAPSAAMAVQPDGKLMVAGTAPVIDPDGEVDNLDFAVVRYTASGALDPTFGSGGKVTTDLSGDTRSDQATVLAVQPDGKIVVAGGTANYYSPDWTLPWDFALVRYTADGALDPTFGSGGKLTTDLSGNGSSDFAYALAVQPDGKIVAAGTTRTDSGGSSDFALVRYTASGALDPTFGSGGRVITDFSGNVNTLAVQPDGKIVVAGYAVVGSTSYDFALMRYTASGALDPTFGSGGRVITDFSGNGSSDFAYALAVQPDGKIVAAGYALTTSSGSYDFALVRYTADGALDPTFGTGGAKITTDGIGGSKIATDFAGSSESIAALAVQPDGKIVAAGSAVTTSGGGYDFAVARYLTSSPGTLQFSAATYTVAENGGSATITVTRTGGDTGAVGVTAGTTITGGGTAAKTDYTHTSVRLSWLNGDTAPKTFTVPIVSDTLIEPDETVKLVLVSPTGGATLGVVTTATLTITNDDAPAFGPYGTAVTADSPAGYWRLNETSGTLAEDSSGNNNHGAYMNGVMLNAAGALAAEAGNTAVTLDGVDDYVRVLDSASLSPTAAVTVEAWVKLTAYSGSYPRLLSKPGSYELTLYTNAGHEGRLEWKVSLAGGDVAVTTDPLLLDHRLVSGQWYHVAATYDGTTGDLRIFINGVQKASKSAPGAVQDGVVPFTISRADRPIAASMDEVAVYGTALSPARVLAHYEAVVPPTPPSQYVTAVTADTPAGYWRLNEANWASAADLSGNGNTGTYTNGVVQDVAGALTSESDAAAQFDGVNDIVRVPDSASLSPTAAVSVETWVMLTAYGSNYPRILSKPGSYELKLSAVPGHEGRLLWHVSRAVGDVEVATAFADRLLLGQWYHVAATYDGTGDLRIFINGMQKASKVATASGAVKDGVAPFTIGRHVGGWALAAKLDEVAVYGTALPLARVQAHYAAR